MKCDHKRVKSVNCVLSCVDCGEILPADFFTAKKAEEPAKKPAEEPKAGKSTSRKRTAKTAE